MESVKGTGSGSADGVFNDQLWESAPRCVKVRAPGKINAFFRAGPLRADGYHAVASTYLAVSRYEEVAVTARPGTPAASVTVSIGVTTNLAGSDSVDALMARADRAMYQAKERGRDQVVLG